MVRLVVRVVPRSSQNRLVREGEILKARLTAPPVDGAANAALLELLASQLDLPRRALRIVQGATSRQKIVEISGLTAEQLAHKL